MVKHVVRVLDDAVRTNARILQEPSDLLEVYRIARELRLYGDFRVVLLQRNFNRLAQRLHSRRVSRIEQLGEREPRLSLNIVLQIDRLQNICGKALRLWLIDLALVQLNVVEAVEIWVWLWYDEMQTVLS